MKANDPHPQNPKNAAKKKPISEEKGFTRGNDVWSYAKMNRDQTITYVLLVLGLLLLLFVNGFLGGLIIGMVAGYYFASEIISYIRNIGHIVKGQDQLRYIVITAVLLGLFISAPSIFIGALIVAAFKNALIGR